MRFVFGIIDKDKNKFISIRERLIDILDEWNVLSCDYPKHQMIMIKAEKLREPVFYSWTRRLNLSQSTIDALLLELESLARKPSNGVWVRKII